jgi:thymidylate synthase (FAD)
VANKEDYDHKEQQEISKMFLPKASTVDLVMSGNFQALYEFLQLRNCVRAEWEIRELSHEITKMMKALLPEIFENCGCLGDEYGICPESHGSCGKYPTKKQARVERI